MTDSLLPGSAHMQSEYSREGQKLRIEFVPSDINEPHRVFDVNTFTELIIVMQHEWRSSDVGFEVNWIPADTPDAKVSDTADSEQGELFSLDEESKTVESSI